MRVVMKPKYGPPDDSGTPSGWPSPTAISTPSNAPLPGGFSMPSDVGFTDAMTKMSRARAQSVSASTSSSTPKKFGC